MPDFRELLNRNRIWVATKLSGDPDYFRKLAEGQSPPFLFFGCSDSRKCINSMIGVEPGELFVHRNIANQVPPHDLNVQAILEYAILTLRVRHVVVGGHSCCGGVGAALAGYDQGAVGVWLKDLRDLARKHEDELRPLPNLLARADRLSEINVVAQLRNVLLSAPFRTSREEGKAPTVHGWMFDLGSGFIRELVLPEEEWRKDGLL